MLHSAEYEILKAHNFENIMKFSVFQDHIKPRTLFFLLIIVKMPTIMVRKISCSAELSMSFFYKCGAWSCWRNFKFQTPYISAKAELVSLFPCTVEAQFVSFNNYRPTKIAERYSCLLCLITVISTAYII